MTKKAKIGVNGWFFCRPFTGIGRYCINVFSELARSYPDLEFHVAIPGRLDEETDKSLRYQDNLKFELISENMALKSLHPGLSKVDWETSKLKTFFRSKGVNLVHLPYPALYRRIKGVPVVMTVHDAIPWTDERYRRRGPLSAWYNHFSLRGAEQADFLLTVSNSSKADIMSLKRFDYRKLEVVYNASEFNDVPSMPEENTKRLLEKIGLKSDDQFLFYMGGFDERKNVGRLVEIFLQEIAPKSELKLVLGGGKVLDNNLFREIETHSPRLVRTGFLSNGELIMLYRRAWAFITLTTREGFDLSLLESITLGCPAVVSDIEVHREIASDTPLFLPLSDSNARIAEKILSLYNDIDVYRGLEAKTMEFAVRAKEKYSWSKTARQIGEIYLKLLQC